MFVSVLCLCVGAQRSAAVLPHFCKSKAFDIPQWGSNKLPHVTESTSELSLWTAKVLLFFHQNLLCIAGLNLPLQLSLYEQTIVIFIGANKFHIHVFRAQLKTLFVFPSASVVLSELCGWDSWHVFGEALYKKYSVLNQVLKGTVMWQASGKLAYGLGRF